MTDQAFQLVSVYDKDGAKKARFEDQYGLVSIDLGKGDTVNVFDTHAETMWFSTVQTTSDDKYPDAPEDGKGDALLVHGSQHLVPPNPERAGKIASGQGPVYRILEEELNHEGVAMGFISRDEGSLPAIDYFEGLYGDVSSRSARANQGAASAGGVLFPKLETMEAQAANGRVLHVFNSKGVAQRLATQHFKKSKRSENLAKWSEAAARGDFKDETRFRFIFSHHDANEKPFYNMPGFNHEIKNPSDLGLTGFEGNMVSSVQASSPAASTGINTESPYAYLNKGGDYPALQKKMSFHKISWSESEDQPETDFQSDVFSEAKLQEVIAQQPKVLLLWREALADEATVRTALDSLALAIRTQETAKLQKKATEEGWFIKMERQPLTAWPPGDSEEMRQGVGPFPADWPGYYMEDAEGNPKVWDPDLHAEPHDEDFYGREFVKQYSYVLARGSKKGPSGPSGDKWMGLAGLYAALFGYNNTQNKSATDLAELFPDRNVEARTAYTTAVVAQIPRAYVNVSEHDDEGLFKAQLLRLAFVTGLNHPNKKADEICPSTDKLRATYKDGKRAVAVGITDEIWQSELGGGDESKLEIYKRLAVPVELVNVGPRGSDDQETREKKNFLLRMVWGKGVEDAWEGRKQGELTKWTAIKRIPDSADDVAFTSLTEAFKAGSEAAKKAAEVLAGSDLVLKQVVLATEKETAQSQMEELLAVAESMTLSGEGLVVVGEISDVTVLSKTGDADKDDAAFRGTAKRLAFKDGLEQKWQEAIHCAKEDEAPVEAEKADDRYPFTFEDLMKAYEDGITQRARDDKKKNAEAEDDVEEDVDECCELTKMILSPFYVPCVMCYDMCCVDMCTKDEDTGVCLLCGTTCSDWLLILACFMFWYMFMGFWYWSLIEILLAVAEPQRPW